MLKAVKLNVDETPFFDFESAALAVSWVRLVLYLSLLVGTQLLQILQGDFLSVEVWQSINVVFFIGMSAHIVYIELIEKARWRGLALETIAYLDIILLGYVIGHLQIYNTLFLFLLLLWVAMAGATMGFGVGTRVAFFGLAVYNFVLYSHAGFRPELLMATFLVNQVSVFAVAFLSGLFHEQLQVVRREFVQKDREIQSLENINDMIVENIASGILVVDEVGMIKKANRGAAKIFSNLHLVNLKLRDLFPELERSLEIFVQDQGRASNQRLELVYFNYKKEKLILETIISQMSFKEGQGRSFLFLIQNLTEVKNLEFQMQQKEKLAAVGQLAAGIAHEIRNPLASISGSVQLLQANLKVQSDEDKKLLNIMIREIDRLNRLITEFLDFVRPESRVEDPININHLTKEILEIAKLNPALSRNIQQSTDLNAKQVIFGHYDKLKQALLNIVINAYQSMGDTLRPELIVQTYDADGEVVLVIRDNGVGISKENLRRIFEPFHTTKSHGTGLGLAITHKILQAHEAKIFVESELGQGTKFSVAFPVLVGPDSDTLVLKKQA